jgi:outer membrane protein OmpA-like peptidoglycan-associated protein
VGELLSVYFDPGQARLDAHGSRQRLDANADVLAACPEIQIAVRASVDACTHVEGIDGRIGRRLSQARADSVATHYLRRGVARSRIARVEGMGPDPRSGVPCDGPEARGRRVDTIPLTTSAGRW